MTKRAIRVPTLRSYLSSQPKALSKGGPYAIILCEDNVAVRETLQYHLQLGFKHVLALSADPLPAETMANLGERVTNVIHETRRPAAHVEAVNLTNNAVAPGTWLYYGFNAEFFIYPFLETRTVGELVQFHMEERRNAMLCFAVDLYSTDLARNPDGVDLDQPHFDGNLHFALARTTPHSPANRQLNFYGGLRWRFEEHVPPQRRRVDRIALFRAAKGLQITPDHRFNNEEYNTYSCKWHNNLTAAVASFRVAKALLRNPGSREQISDFGWHNSRRFNWTSQELMDLGLMEPGQWF